LCAANSHVSLAYETAVLSLSLSALMLWCCSGFTVRQPLLLLC
jgi:hypothetical protein